MMMLSSFLKTIQVNLTQLLLDPNNPRFSPSQMLILVYSHTKIVTRV